MLKTFRWSLLQRLASTDQLKLDGHCCVLCVFFAARVGLTLWCRLFFWCVWYGLRSSRTCFYIDASDSLLRVQERAVLVDNRQTHRTRHMPCACSFMKCNTWDGPIVPFGQSWHLLVWSTYRTWKRAFKKDWQSKNNSASCWTSWAGSWLNAKMA